MKDRKEYWRAYQKRRYQILREQKQSQPALKEQLNARYKEECLLRGIPADHKFWRTRRKLKLSLHQELGTSPELLGLDSLKQWLWDRSHKRAKAGGFEFSIQPSDITLPDKCAILKISIDYSQIGNGRAPNAPSVDRIDNTIGYVPGNIQVVSHRANKLKNDATLEELALLGSWARRQLLSAST